MSIQAKPQTKTTLVLSLLLLATLGCISSQAATPSAAPVVNSYKLQILKNCQLVKERALTAEEIALYHQLKQAEINMAALQAPLTDMEQLLATHSKTLETMSGQIEQQAYQQGEPDPLLLETQAELSQQMSAIVDSFAPDIEAVSVQGKRIGVIADQFTSLLKTDMAPTSYDQMRIAIPGDTTPNDCQHGIFFQKSSTM